MHGFLSSILFSVELDPAELAGKLAARTEPDGEFKCRRFLHLFKTFLQTREGVNCTVFVFLFNFIYPVA
jgi:hypothetical protein